MERMKRFLQISRYGALSLITFTSSSFFISSNEENEEKKWMFDTKGFPTHQRNFKSLPPYPNWSKPLLLSAVGMRRKNLYLFEVDVYMTGLSLLEATLHDLQANQNLTPAKAVLASQVTNPNLNGQPVAFVTCRFVRDVGLNSILDAFQETFIGLPSEDILEFRNQLGAAVGAHGVKKGDEVIFAWLNNGGMKILLNGVVGGQIKNHLVEERLIEVYVDQKRAVSPQLLQSLHENLSKIPTDSKD